MSEEYRAICKDCTKEFGYSQNSLQAGGTRGLSRPERCPACRRLHTLEGRAIGIPQINMRPRSPRKPDGELQPGRLGKIFHPERPHRKVEVEGKFGRPDTPLEFGITDEDIRQLIRDMETHQVTVVVGPTGSGKSTFLPYRLIAPPEEIDPNIFTRYGQIVVTQPRIQATRTVAQFVARDLHGCSLGAGFDVGFRHSNAPFSDWRNKLVYTTDGTLINWIVGGQIGNLSVIMIDEAHERSLNIDLILGLLKRQLPRYPHLRLIIASATINAQLFREFFGGPEKVALRTFRGLKQYQVTAYFPPHDDKLTMGPHVPKIVAQKVIEILEDSAGGKKGEGDVLAFLPGEREIEECARILRGLIVEREKLRDRGIGVYPLYARLPVHQQDVALAKKSQVVADKVLDFLRHGVDHSPNRILALLLDDRSARAAAELVEKALREEELHLSGADWMVTCHLPGQESPNSFPGQIIFTTRAALSSLANPEEYRLFTDRRVIISTNVAETSLTVDGITYVVDSGLIKEAAWDCRDAAIELAPRFHSRAGCRQRWGRAGRVRDGEAHLLYTDLQFEEDFQPYSLPEILRSSLDQVVLKAKAAGIDHLDPARFDWIEPPDSEELVRVSGLLEHLGALDADGDLTSIGVELESFAADVPIANLLMAADQLACGLEMATLAALSPLNLRGGLLQWNFGWDFPTRQGVEEIFARLAQACQDDLELYFKVYAIWAEARNETERAQHCQLFFIDQVQLETKVLPARRKFLEMLAIGKKMEEDRGLNFALLDRLRIVLATAMPAQYIYTCQQQGDSRTYRNLVGEEVALELEEDSALASPPAFFLALKRRKITSRDGGKRLVLSGLVHLKEDWLQWRGLPTLALAGRIESALRSRRGDQIYGSVRQRLFLEVCYPLGASYRKVRDDRDRPQPGERLALAPLFVPVFPLNRYDLPPDPLEETPRDILSVAGCEDLDATRLARDPLEEAPRPDSARESLEDGDDEVGAATPEVRENESGGRLPGFDETGLIKTREMAAAAELLPGFRWEGGDRPSEVCEVVGYDMTDPYDSEVILRDGAGKDIHTDLMTPGTTVTVTGVEVVQSPRGERALRVKETTAQVEFLVDPQDLTFSGRWAAVEEFQGQTFSMEVQQRGGAIRLTCLPLAEKSLHDFIRSNAGAPVEGKILESVREGWHVLLLPSPQTPLPPGRVLTAFLRSPDRKVTFDGGTTHTFFLSSTVGEAWVSLPCPPPALLEFIEKEKFDRKVFWNRGRQRLHTKAPMTGHTRENLLQFRDSPEYQNAINRVYLMSNRLRVLLSLSGGKPVLEWGGGRREKFVTVEVPEYQGGELIRGMVSVIFPEFVLVNLEKGGTGNIPSRELSGRRLLDAREVVNVDQEVEARVLSQTSQRIDLTLLVVEGKAQVPRDQMMNLRLARNNIEEQCNCRLSSTPQGEVKVRGRDPSGVEEALAALKKLFAPS